MESSGRITNWLPENSAFSGVLSVMRNWIQSLSRHHKKFRLWYGQFGRHIADTSQNCPLLVLNLPLSMFSCHSAASHLGLLSKHPVKALKDNLDLSESWWYFPYIHCPGMRGKKKNVMCTAGALGCWYVICCLIMACTMMLKCALNEKNVSLRQYLTRLIKKIISAIHLDGRTSTAVSQMVLNRFLRCLVV